MTPQEQPDSQATLWQDVAEYFLGDYAREHTPDECRKEAYRRSVEADSQVGDEQITYGVDMGAPDGDKTALSIKRGDIVYSFVGDEAEVILAYAERLATRRAVEASKNKMTGEEWYDRFKQEFVAAGNVSYNGDMLAVAKRASIQKHV